VASNRNVVDRIFRISPWVVNDWTRRGEVMLESIDAESRVNVKANHMSDERSSREDDRSALPVTNRENNVFFLNFGQRAILPRLSSLFLINTANRRDSSVTKMIRASKRLCKSL